MLLVSHAALAGGGTPLPIGRAESLFEKAMATSQLNTAAFLALGCITATGKESVAGFQAGSAKALHDTVKEYGSYMSFVSKPMEGNGKCDGGFQAVVTEAGRRLDRSLKAADRVKQIEDAYHAQAVANLFTPVITFNDSDGGGCLSSADELYDAMETNANHVRESIGEIHRALLNEAERFRIYQAKNDALRIRCGESEESLNTPIHSAAAQGTGKVERVPAGQAENGASDITGIHEDAEKRSKAGEP